MAIETPSTVQERSDAHIAALRYERGGYEARLASLKDGGEDRLTEAKLVSRIAQVDAALKSAGAK